MGDGPKFDSVAVVEGGTVEDMFIFDFVETD